MAKTKDVYTRSVLLVMAVVGGLLFAFLILIFFGARLLTAPRGAMTQQSSSDSGISILEEITQVAFYELTIPHLRNREYSSALGEFEKIEEKETYTSYLTSYDSDGLTVNGVLTVPRHDSENDPLKTANKYPALVFVHGYIPPAQYRPTENYEAYVDYFARNGFVVFKIDLRGHADSQGEAQGAYYSPDYVVDVLNARAALQQASFVASDDIGLWGHSMAGNVVLRALAARPEIPAAVIWAGAVYTYEDLQTFGIDDNSYQPPQQQTERQQRRAQLREAHGEFSAESPFWRQVAPTNYLRDLSGAIQLHHAQDDTVVSIEYSRNLRSLLEEAGVPHELHEYNTGGHNISGTSFSVAMQRSLDFFRSHFDE